MLEKALYENFVAAFSEEGKRIINREVESRECALNAEHEAFVSSKLATSYKSSILKLVSEARKLTQSHTPHPCFSVSCGKDPDQHEEGSESQVESCLNSHYLLNSASDIGDKNSGPNFEDQTQAGLSVTSAFQFQTASELLSLSKGVNKPFKPPTMARSMPKSSSTVTSIDTKACPKVTTISNPSSKMTEKKGSGLSSRFCTASELDLASDGKVNTKPFSKYSVISKLFGEGSDEEDDLSQQKYPESFPKKSVNFNDMDSPTMSKNLLIDLTDDEVLDTAKNVHSSDSLERSTDKSSTKKNVGKSSNIPKIVYFFERKEKEGGGSETECNKTNSPNLSSLEIKETVGDIKSKSSSLACGKLQVSKKHEHTSSSHSKDRKSSSKSTSSRSSNKRKISDEVI